MDCETPSPKPANERELIARCLRCTGDTLRRCSPNDAARASRAIRRAFKTVAPLTPAIGGDSKSIVRIVECLPSYGWIGDFPPTVRLDAVRMERAAQLFEDAANDISPNMANPDAVAVATVSAVAAIAEPEVELDPSDHSEDEQCVEAADSDYEVQVAADGIADCLLRTAGELDDFRGLDSTVNAIVDQMLAEMWQTAEKTGAAGVAAHTTALDELQRRMKDWNWVTGGFAKADVDLASLAADLRYAADRVSYTARSRWFHWNRDFSSAVPNPNAAEPIKPIQPTQPTQWWKADWETTQRFGHHVNSSAWEVVDLESEIESAGRITPLANQGGAPTDVTRKTMAILSRFAQEVELGAELTGVDDLIGDCLRQIYKASPAQHRLLMKEPWLATWDAQKQAFRGWAPISSSDLRDAMLATVEKLRASERVL